MDSKKYKIMCYALAFSMASLSLTGCQSNNNTTTTEKTTSKKNTFTYTDDASAAPTDTTISGRVDSVDGDTVTLSVMEGMPGDKPDGNDSQNNAAGDQQTPPDKPDGSDSQSDATGDQQTPPDKPDGSDSQSNAAGDQQTPPDKPDSNDSQSNAAGDQQTPPDKPDGSDSQSNATGDQQTPPDKPDGSDSQSNATGDQQTPPSGGSAPGNAKAATLTIQDASILTKSDGSSAITTDITEGSMLTITFDEDGTITSIVIADGTAPSAPQGQGGADSASIDYQAVNTYTEDTSLENEALASTGTDENAALVESGTLTLTNSTITRTSSDSTGGDNASFYGVGAALLTKGGTTNISDTTISTDAAGGAGLFAYGDGTIQAENCTITTKQDTSGGIHVAGGGTLNATNLTVTTDGNSSAAIRSDRGGGTMTVKQGSYTSNGTGSPAVYCTADISVSDATLTANGSEAVCIEGLNSLKLTNCDISSNMADDSQNDTTWSMIVYQSMSGDSEIGNSTLEVTGGSLTAKNGGILYTTNTECNITFSDVDITYPDDCEFFLRCTGNQNQRGWGQTGSNGSQCTFTADNQTMQGDVIWDSISTLDFTMQNGSTLTGSILDDESCAGDGGDGYCNLTISKDSTWVVTGNSTLSKLSCEGTIQDDSGKTVTIQNTDGTVYVQGDSAYTITVTAYN